MLAGLRCALADAYRLLAERYADASTPQLPQAASRSCVLGKAGEEAAPAMWSFEGEKLYVAHRDLGRRRELHAIVEGLGETEWDWHVWDTAGQGQPRYDVVDTL